jgi:hypothetical protein
VVQGVQAAAISAGGRLPWAVWRSAALGLHVVEMQTASRPQRIKGAGEQNLSAVGQDDEDTVEGAAKGGQYLGGIAFEETDVVDVSVGD